MEKLFKLIQDHNLYLSLTYSNSTNFAIQIYNGYKFSEDGYRRGEIEYISQRESPDITAVLAQAYVDLTEWLSENRGGY